MIILLIIVGLEIILFKVDRIYKRKIGILKFIIVYSK